MADYPRTIGHYDVLRRIATGGMAEVFLAKQTGLKGFEKLVVIKRILPHMAKDEEFSRMFLDEARTAADLRHGNIVQILEVGEESGQYHIVMEFLHGQDVRNVLRRQVGRGGRVPLQHALQMILDTAAGLHYAHNKKDLQGRPLGIVHRDISPQNLIVTYDGSTKLVDFGVAKAATQQVRTRTGVMKGKYAYMSPEQAALQPLDHRSDQFALGIVAWELTLAQRLFRYPNEMMTLHAVLECNVTPPAEAMPGYPRALSDIIMKAMAKDPEDRYPDVATFASVLEDYMASEGIAHSPARVATYMRELFADEIEEEGQLGHPVVADDVGDSPSNKPRAPQTQLVDRGRNPAPSPPAARTSRRAPWGTIAAVVLALAVVGGGIGALLAWPGPTESLAIESEPVGAAISIDGVDSSTITPNVFNKMEVDRIYEVGLTLDGYEPFQAKVRIVKGQGGAVKAKLRKLEPKYGVVKFTSEPPGARVFLNGTPVQQRTPFEYARLLVGSEFTVSFSLDGYQSVTRSLRVAEGYAELHVELTP